MWQAELQFHKNFQFYVEVKDTSMTFNDLPSSDFIGMS